MWALEENGGPMIQAPGIPFKRDVAGNSGVISYWAKDPSNMTAPNGHNDLHFTLGEIIGNKASFHATWHARGVVTHYICSIDSNGAIIVDVDQTNSGNVGVSQTDDIARPLGKQIYSAKRIDIHTEQQERQQAIRKQKVEHKARGRLFSPYLKKNPKK